MSEIPYYFDTPIPRYFRENGWFKNPKMLIFLHWAFARCSTEKRVIYHIQKAIELDPFEFIFGRRICSEETGLTENEIRSCIHQLNHTPFGTFLQKATSKSTNKYTVYKWSITGFSKTNNQQRNQQTTSRPPADHHKSDHKIIDLIDIDLIDSAGAQEIFENANPNMTRNNLEHNIDYQDTHGTQEPQIVKILKEKNYSSEEISSALERYKKKPRKVSDLVQYLKTSIDNQRVKILNQKVNVSSQPKTTRPAFKKTPSRSLSEEYSKLW